VNDKLFVKIVIGLLLVVLISAFLAPLLAMFLDYKFRRILARCIEIGVFLLIAFFVRQQKINASQFFRAMGFSITRESLKLYVKGFLICSIFITGIVFFQIIFGARSRQMELAGVELLLNTLKIIGAAVLIGVIEEVFFRGIIYRGLYKSGVPFAFLLSAFVYAVVHFFTNGSVFVDETPSVIDSFRVIGAFFSNFKEPSVVMPACVGLLFFGFVLNSAYANAGSLLFPMGIHAGAVFCLKLSKSVFAFHEGASPILIGTGVLYDGMLGWAFLIGLWLLMYQLFKKEKDKGHVGLFGKS
jgi:uncharacterized protein